MLVIEQKETCCGSHSTLLEHNAVNAARVLQIDPTRTITIRNQFVAEATRRWRKIVQEIIESVNTNDVFGLKPDRDTTGRPVALPSINIPLGKNAYKFDTDPQKVGKFMKWLTDLDNKGILEITTGDARAATGNVPWANRYIDSAYKRGMRRADAELVKAGVTLSKLPADQRAFSIDSRFNQPFHADKVAQIYTRVYSGLSNITTNTEALVTTTLAQGLAEGRNPNDIARLLRRKFEKAGSTLALTDPTTGRTRMSAILRSRILARTEVIRAHHVATINTYREAGIEGVIVKVEWSTAGDDRVCPDCQDLEGQIFTLKEIEGLIPLHPQCRCVALPVPVGTTKVTPVQGGGIGGSTPPSVPKSVAKQAKAKAKASKKSASKPLTPEEVTVPPIEKNPGGYFRGSFKNDIGFDKLTKDEIYAKYSQELKTTYGSKYFTKFESTYKTAKGYVDKNPSKFLKKPKVKKVKATAPSPTPKPPTGPGVADVETNGWTPIKTDKEFTDQIVARGWAKGATVDDLAGIHFKNNIGRAIVEIEETLPGAANIMKSRQFRLNQMHFTGHTDVSTVRYKYWKMRGSKNVGGSHFKANNQALFSDTDRLSYGSYKNFGIDAGRHNVQYSTRGVFRHEMGHHLQSRIKFDAHTEWLDVRGKVNFRKDLSVYSGKNEREAFAESFCAYSSPQYVRGTMPKLVEQWFDKWVAGEAKGFHGTKPLKIKKPLPKLPKAKGTGRAKASQFHKLENPTVEGVEEWSKVNDKFVKFLKEPVVGKSSQRGKLKEHVEKQIQKQIKKSTKKEREAYQQFLDVFRVHNDARSSSVRSLIQQWAGTSMDKSELSVFLQQMAKKEFALKGAGMTHVGKATLRGIKNILSHAGTDAKAVEKGARVFLKAMYRETQEEFARQGIKEMTLYRGMSVKKAKALALQKMGTYTIQPMSSFSTSIRTAKGFSWRSGTGETPVIVVSKVPVERIIGCPRTGYGCLNEYEVVVLGQSKAKGAVWLRTEGATTEIEKALKKALANTG